jgi:hypothetical protein
MKIENLAMAIGNLVRNQIGGDLFDAVDIAYDLIDRQVIEITEEIDAMAKLVLKEMGATI